jgi:tRNA G10  N-methylase Trm11
LLEKQSDYNYISYQDVEVIGKTIWIQNINSYSKRDFSKERDMQTGMLPPKLAQMMLNIGKPYSIQFGEITDQRSIFDPFV